MIVMLLKSIHFIIDSDTERSNECEIIPILLTRIWYSLQTTWAHIVCPDLDPHRLTLW